MTNKIIFNRLAVPSVKTFSNAKLADYATGLYRIDEVQREIARRTCKHMTPAQKKEFRDKQKHAADSKKAA